MTIDLLTFGECMASLRSHAVGPLARGAKLTLSCAGAEATVAVGVGRLGHAATWVGRVGDDEFGHLVTDALRGAGVDTHALVDPLLPTGLMVRSARTPTTTRVAYYREHSAGSRIAPADVLPFVDRDPRILHLTGITPALGGSACEAVLAAAAAARSRATIISYDVNLRNRLTTVADAAQVLRELLGSIDILFFGEDELEVVAAAVGCEPDPLAVRDALTGLELVLKRGRRGATAYAGGEIHDGRSLEVDSIDSIGAGDSFVAGYLSAVLDGLSIPDRLLRGAETAAFTVVTEGDWEGLPMRSELSLIGGTDDSAVR
jgi:2-dehydro-3-deoxygluconokinase